MNYRALGVPVTIGLGGTIDLLAGMLKRAPRWMQRTGIEWLYRLAQEPHRLFRRYLKDLLVFGWSILAQFWSFRRGLRTQEATQETENRTVPDSDRMQTDSIWHQVEIPRKLDLTITRDEQFFASLLPVDGRHCLLHMDKVGRIDSTGMGLLIRLQQHIRASGRQLVLLAPSRAVQRALQAMRLEGFFCAAPDVAGADQILQNRLREEYVLVALGKTAETDTLFWQGEITAANAGTVWEQTRAYLASSLAGPQAIIDLSSVRFIDSSALGVMVRARTLALEQGVRLLFTGLCPAVLNVVRLARVEDLLLRH
jgi:N-acetylglucosaminyldiphosphoundecaprenol N-acetyl-beta-D-mannosaminyltransferase